MGMSLPDPIELCLEELDDASDAEPYVRCIAVTGGSPGLCFSPAGEVLWRLNENASAEIWVSLDGRLMLFRKSLQAQVSLTRVERHLELPLGKPVIVLGGDEISVAGKRFRVHVHGTTAEARPPERLKLRRARNLAVAAAIALGALTADCKHGATGGSTATTSSATATPSPVTAASHDFKDARTAPAAGAGSTNGAAPDAGTADAKRTKGLRRTPPHPATPPIQIRDYPPAPSYKEPEPEKANVAALPTLSQGDIVSAMKAVQPRVGECYNQHKVPGIVSVSISVSKGGRIASATVTGKFAGTPSGKCVEAAAKTARFPPCEAMDFPWHFALE